jgi:cell division protease FtsH
MANDKNFKPDVKKGFPGGIFFFLFVIFLVIFIIQSLSSDKKGQVAFGYQIEHLVNLDLVKPQENKKIAQSESLVTFSGKFRDVETEEGKYRFRYLELLEKNHVLFGEKERLLKELLVLQENVKDAAIWFLEITAMPLSTSGYTVVGTIYDTPERINSIIIKSIDDKDVVNLPQLEQLLNNVKQGNNALLEELNSKAEALVKLFKSPNLGIGADTLKKELKNAEAILVRAKNSANIQEKIDNYSSFLTMLKNITDTLNVQKDNVRLLSLRSVRNYMETIEGYNLVQQQLVQNELQLNKARQKVADVIWFFNNKELATRSLEKQDTELFTSWFNNAKKEWDNFPANKGLSFKAPDQSRNTVLEKTFRSEEPAPNYLNYIFTILPVALVIFAIYFIFSKQMKGVGSSAMNFGKSPAKLLTKEANKFTFNDVAGCDEAKEELKEVVDFLKDPKKFTTLGARIPKGILLVGSPGTGKTLMAKAVAGEADRPFFSISGSDFVEMFVGVGASRIRDLFDQAKRSAPCIVFIDEIDAVGRHRGAGIGGGHDEREQTLNQLLVEMDGFDTKEGVILMAATNRPDILDRALLRPGRFDRRVVLDLPDIKGRYEILKVHIRKIKVDKSVDLMEIAKITPGASGADLENILNEAALLAARRGRSAVTAQETREACDKVRFGKERRSLDMDENEKKTTAVHEAGHAIVGLKVQFADPVDKVTIIPRGFSLGATHFMPKKNRLSYWRKEVLDQLAIMMGGRSAEEIFLSDVSSGAQQDITQATKLARAMVCEWGMSDALGAVSYDERQGGEQYLGIYGAHEKNYSDETAEIIDKEVKKLIADAHVRAKEIIQSHKDKVQMMADMLMEFETLDSQDIKEIMDGTWNADKKKERLKMQDALQKKTTSAPTTTDKKDVLEQNKIIEPQEG